MCLLLSFILLSCSTVRKVTPLAKLRNLLESWGVCLLWFSHSGANMKWRILLENRKCESLAKTHSRRRDCLGYLEVSQHSPSSQTKVKFGFASRVEDGNCTIWLRKLLWKIPRDFYTHFNDSSFLQRGFESSHVFKMPSRTVWQLSWKF